MDHWKEQLAAMVPYYAQDGGNATLIYYGNGEVKEDRRTLKWNLRRLARNFSVDLEAARLNYGRYLDWRQGVPLPFSLSLVMTPLKMRQAFGKNDGCYGYINACAVEDCLPEPGEKSGCLLCLEGGHRLSCLFSLRTTRQKLNAARLVLERYRVENNPASRLADHDPLPGLPAEWRALLGQLLKMMIMGSGNSK